MNKGRREGQGERANNNKEFSYVFVWCLFRSLIGPKSGQNPKKKKHPNLQPHWLFSQKFFFGVSFILFSLYFFGLKSQKKKKTKENNKNKIKEERQFHDQKKNKIKLKISMKFHRYFPPINRTIKIPEKRIIRFDREFLFFRLVFCAFIVLFLKKRKNKLFFMKISCTFHVFSSSMK